MPHPPRRRPPRSGPSTPPATTRIPRDAPGLVRAGLALVVGALVLALSVLALPAHPHTAAATRPASRSAPAGHAPRPTAAAHRALAAAARPRHAAPAPAPAAQGRAVLLRRGDTLWGLARRYGTTVAELQRLNGLGTSTLIYAGHRLVVPGTVVPGRPRRVSTVPDLPISRAPRTGQHIAGHRSTPGAVTPTAPTHTTSNPRTFQGIFAFSGPNSADLATDPDIAGRSLVYYWSQLEPRPGVYRWDLIDRDLRPWAAAGKKVVLRVSAAGWAKWDPAAGSGHGTPAWVYAQGVTSVTERDGAVLPQYWNPAFQRNLAVFLKALADRYDGNPHLAAVDISVGVGGETKPDSEKNPDLLALWQSIGYTDPAWWACVQQTITAYTTAFHRTPLALMPDKTFLGNTPGYDEHRLLAYAVAKGLWLQDNGVLPGRTLPAPWGRTPVLAEMRGSTAQTGDSLAADLQAALAEHPVYILAFTSDLTNAANRAAIHQVALQAHATSSGGTGPVRCRPAPIRAQAAATGWMCPLTAPSRPRGSRSPAESGNRPGHRAGHRNSRIRPLPATPVHRSL
ncbi:LysM peptidoglycan-binding domain-containing protein [Streptomyces sp. NPDC101152]|uniref:LysM peptidoglycan-binding domain-containing protein n=1 Tax=Streptomyces sp. NPDC101152 TaxID=3366116 RepID=UPI0038181579